MIVLNLVNHLNRLYAVEKTGYSLFYFKNRVVLNQNNTKFFLLIKSEKMLQQVKALEKRLLFVVSGVR